jgi:predicted phage-related endonuclease
MVNRKITKPKGIKLNILELKQGSELWQQVRLNHFTASESCAMMGASKYQTRDALLKLKATGIAPEVTDAQQVLFNKGHAAEAAARPIIEAIIGQEFYPVTGSLEVEGLPLLASFDGITLDETIVFEHKLWNQKLSAAVHNDDLEPHYFWQLEHQLLVSGAEKIVFTVSDGTEENFIYLDYISKPERRKQLIEGWKQFAKDLATYVVPEAEAPKVIAEPVETLPAITYQTTMHSTGLGLISNLDDYKAAAARLVEQSKKQLETDQDFANAEARTKQCKEAEKRIAVIQSNVVGEVADIDKFVKDLGAISEMLRQCRLNEEKQITKRKDDIRAEAISAAQQALLVESMALDAKLGGFSQLRMPKIQADFAGVIRGLKTIASLKSKLNDELARAKAEANTVFNKMVSTLENIQKAAGDKMFLFADLQQLVLRDADTVDAIVFQRLAGHEAAEAKRLADEQARIQAEAQRIANEQIERDRAAAEQKEKAELARQQEEIAKAQAAAVEAVQPLELEVAPVREEQCFRGPATTTPHAPHLTFSKVATTSFSPAANTAEDFTKVDQALDSVLRASGSALRHYTMLANLEKMREAMQAIMKAEYIAGSNDCHKAMTKTG